MRVAAEIELSGKDREQLGKWAAARNAPVRLRSARGSSCWPRGA